MQDFRNLRAWQAARELTRLVYETTATFPPSERYGLSAQMRSAATSVCANIAEGAGRGSKADSKHCCQIAFGSATELLCHAVISCDLGYVSPDRLRCIEEMLERVRGLLGGLMTSLRKVVPAGGGAYRRA